jgi:hypothetical protein
MKQSGAPPLTGQVGNGSGNLGTKRRPNEYRRRDETGGRMVEIQPLIAYETTNVPFCLQPTERAELRRQATATAAGLPGLQLFLAAALTPNGTRCRRPFGLTVGSSRVGRKR